MAKHTPRPAPPRLIRPTKDGEEGGWSYLFHANGEDFIFPAIVNELGSLKPLIEKDANDPPTPDTPAEGTLTLKVVYWKASDWDTKLLPLAIDWVSKNGFTFPNVPYPYVELRKIEDRDGEDRVAEVLNVIALDQTPDNPEVPTLLVHQFTDVGGEEGKGRRPLLQWWMQDVIRFDRGKLQCSGWSVPRAAARIANWSEVPGFLRNRVDERGAAEFFKTLSVDANSKELDQDALRAVTVWLALSLYISSLKTVYVGEGGPSRRSAPKTTEEALALEQATLFKSVGVLKSGIRKKPVATGTGTKHRYRYLVRGHERIVNGKSIWIKPQIRGEGEFMAIPVGVTDAAQESAKVIEPPAPVTVSVPVTPEPAPEPARHEPAPKPRLSQRVAKFLRGFFRSFTSRP